MSSPERNNKGTVSHGTRTEICTYGKTEMSSYIIRWPERKSGSTRQRRTMAPTTGTCQTFTAQRSRMISFPATLTTATEVKLNRKRCSTSGQQRGNAQSGFSGEVAIYWWWITWPCNTRGLGLRAIERYSPIWLPDEAKALLLLYQKINKTLGMFYETVTKQKHSLDIKKQTTSKNTSSSLSVPFSVTIS